MNVNQQKNLYYFFILLFIFSAMLTLTLGETPLNKAWIDFKAFIFFDSQDWNPIFHERIPRLIILFMTGASLAVSGAAMQSIFQNPLASPSVLGISSGGVLAVIICLIFGWDLFFPFIIPFSAFFGSLLILFIVYTLSSLQKGAHLTNLILTGIALSTLLIAIQSLILYMLRDQWQLIQTITEWEAASTIDRTWQQVHMQFPLAIVGLVGCWHYREELNLLSLGEEEAANLGVNVKSVRWKIFFSIALLTGGAIAALGMVPFFGLITPHIIRHFVGPNNRFLIPLCFLGGGALLTGLDIFLRAMNLNFLSLGNLCGLVGGCFFLVLLFRQQRRNRAQI